MLRTACILAALCLLSHASAAGRTLLAPANGPPTTSAEGTSILNAILAKKVGVTSFGEKTEVRLGSFTIASRHQEHKRHTSRTSMMCVPLLIASNSTGA